MNVKDVRGTFTLTGDHMVCKSTVNMHLATTSMTVVSSFRLLELPLEIRQLIYTHVLNKTRFINGRVLERYVTGKPDGLPPLCRLSSQIRAEAFGVFLRSSTINFSSYPRPNVTQINRYITAHDLRIHFWQNVLQAHLTLRFPGRPHQDSANGRLYQLVQAASGLKYLELTFSGWPQIPSGFALLNAIGGYEMLELLTNRPKLEEMKFIWTVNAPGWGPYRPNIDDLRVDRWKWEEAMKQLQGCFLQQGVRAKVTPWMESADRRLWDELLAAKVVS